MRGGRKRHHMIEECMADPAIYLGRAELGRWGHTPELSPTDQWFTH